MWAAAVIEVVVQFAAAAWLEGVALGVVLAVDFGLFAGYVAWLWERGVTATSTREDARRPGAG